MQAVTVTFIAFDIDVEQLLNGDAVIVKRAQSQFLGTLRGTRTVRRTGVEIQKPLLFGIFALI